MPPEVVMLALAAALRPAVALDLQRAGVIVLLSGVCGGGGRIMRRERVVALWVCVRGGGAEGEEEGAMRALAHVAATLPDNHPVDVAWAWLLASLPP